MTAPIFQFLTGTYPVTDFVVTDFTGRESISELFEFNITTKVADTLVSYFFDVDASTTTLMGDTVFLLHVPILTDHREQL